MMRDDFARAFQNAFWRTSTPKRFEALVPVLGALDNDVIHKNRLFVSHLTVVSEWNRGLTL